MDSETLCIQLQSDVVVEQLLPKEPGTEKEAQCWLGTARHGWHGRG